MSHPVIDELEEGGKRLRSGVDRLRDRFAAFSLKFDQAEGPELVAAAQGARDEMDYALKIVQGINLEIEERTNVDEED